MTRFDGKVAIVTGSGQGLGRLYAEALAGEGAKVIVAEVNEDNAQLVAASITSKGGDAFAARTDVSSPESCDEMARVALERFGRIDILINNAAVFDGLHMTALDSIDIDEWDKVMSVNVKGIWLATRAVAPQMRAQGNGCVINVSSAAALFGPPLMLHYVASKGAVMAMTRSLAKELGESGIRVTGVAPGMTFTAATDRFLADPAIAEMHVAMQALKQRVEPDKVVPLVLFLCSDEADLIAGQTYVVDGGMVMP